MTEIFSILFIVTIYTFVIFLPFYEIFSYKFKDLTVVNSLDKYAFNILFLINFILVLSLIDIKIQYLVYFVYLISRPFKDLGTILL